MAEQVDAADLKSVGSNPVPVRFRPSAPIKKEGVYTLFFYWYVSIGSEPRFGIEVLPDLFGKS